MKIDKTLKMLQTYIGYDYSDGNYYITTSTLNYLIDTYHVNLYIPKMYTRADTRLLVIRNSEKWWDWDKE